MAVSNKLLECPVCLDFFEKPIKQCVIGHSFCGKCLDPLNVKLCPECRSPVTDTRNYKLEELLDTVLLPCDYKDQGCPFVLDKEDMAKHVFECKYRKQKCEGKVFCDWKCDWEGYDILKHFKEKHDEKANMEFSYTTAIPYNVKNTFTDLHLISAHYQQFWYKHKVDVVKMKVYWAIQLIGLRKNASYYYYEFEIFNTEDPIKKFKITEYCTSDVEHINDIFETEKCVAISFKMLKNYVNKKNLYSFRFRLMKIPNPEKARSKSATRVPNKSKYVPVPQNIPFMPHNYGTERVANPFLQLPLPTPISIPPSMNANQKQKQRQTRYISKRR